MLGMRLRVSLALLAFVWFTGREALAGYEPVNGESSRVLYNTSSRSRDGITDYRIFPNVTSIAEEDIQYFFNELNFNDVPGSLLVGAADSLYLLSKDLTVRSSYSWETDEGDYASCVPVNDNPRYSCRNHIRVYKRFPTNESQLLVCGTQGDSAHQCRTLEISSDVFGSASATVQSPNGFLSPYPEYPGFGEFVNRNSSDDRFFSAGFPISGNQFSISYYSIPDTNGAPQVNKDFTNDANNRWVNYPGTLVDYYRADYPPLQFQFNTPLSSDAYQFYFLFMREYQIIDRTFDIIYSRVVRICRNDPGSTGVGVQGERFFTSFLKARISCVREVPPGRQFTGTVDYEYNEIVSVAFNDEGRYSENDAWMKQMYGAFTGPSIGSPGTAICLYRAGRAAFDRGIFAVFEEDLLEPNGVEVEQTFVECNPAGRSDDHSQRVQVVQSISQKGVDPLIILDGLTVTQMMVERVCVVRSVGGGTACRNQDVLFLGTDTGRILKVVFSTVSSQSTDPIVAEEITLDDTNSVNRLTIEEGEDGSRHLFANTFSRLYRLPLERCVRHQSCSECIRSRDPYCVWNTTSLSCQSTPLTAVNDGIGAVPAELKQNVHDPESIMSVCQYPTIQFISSTLTVDEDTPSISLTLTSSTTGASGLVEIYTMNGTATAGDDYVATVATVNFDPGQNVTTISIPLMGDSVYEGSEFETFTVGLRATGMGGVNIGDVGVVTVTLTENDAVSVGVGAAGVSVREGDGYVSVVLVKTGAATVSSSLLFTTMDGGALAGQDYVTVEETVTFDPDQSQVTVLVPLIDDNVVESDEMFVGVVSLSSISTGVQIGAADTVTITILDDDYPTIQFISSTLTVDEDTPSISLALSSSTTGASGLVEIYTTDGTATAGDDYVATVATVNFDPGQNVTTITVPLMEDSVYEGSEFETFTVGLRAMGMGGVNIGDVGVVTVTLTENDAVSVGVGAAGVSVREGDGYVSVVLVKTGTATVSSSLLFTTMDGGALAGQDYVSVEETVTFDPDQSQITVLVPLIDDNVVESDEMFVGVVSLSSISTGVQIGAADTVTITILDDDYPTIQFVSSTLTVDEDTPSISLTLTSSTTGASGLVEIYTTDGTATAGDDYVATVATVNFDPGQNVTTITVPLMGDSVYEGSEFETFTVGLRATGMDGVNIGDVGVVTVTLTENDAVSVGVGAAGVSVREGDGYVSVVLVKTGAATVSSSLLFTTMDGGALAGQDYVSVEETVTFDPDQSQVTVLVPIIDDKVVESDEMFVGVVILSSISMGVQIGAANTVTITILDDDYPTIQFVSSTLTVDEDTPSISLTLTSSTTGASGLVEIYTTDGTATAGDDYVATVATVNFDPGQNVTTVSIPLMGDSVYEGSEFETFTVGLRATGMGGVNIGDVGVVTVTLTENDAVSVGVGAAGVSVREGDGYVSVVLVKTGAATVSSSLLFTTMDGGALAGQDYVTVEETVTFDPDQSQITVLVPLIDDNVVESDEMFVGVVSLSSISTGVQIGAADTVTITILDDDYPTIQFVSSTLTVDEDTPSISLTLTSSTTEASGLVEIYTMDGTATAGDDYVATVAAVNFDPGQNVTTVSIPLMGDSIYEGSEFKTFTVGLRATGMGGVNIGNVGVVTVTLIDNDSISVGFQTSAVSVSEGVGFVDLVVTREGASQLPVSVLLSTLSQSTAIPLSDFYLPSDVLLRIDPSQSNTTQRLFIVDDAITELPEMIVVGVAIPVFYVYPRVVVGENNTITITVADDDATTVPPTVDNSSESPPATGPGSATGPGVNVGNLGDSVFSSAVDSGVVLAILIALVVLLAIVVVVLSIILIQKRRTEKLIRKSLGDEVHPTDKPRMNLTGMTVQNKYYRESSSSQLLPLESPTSVSSFTLRDGPPTTVKNLSAIMEETNGDEDGDPVKRNLEEDTNSNSEDDLQSSTIL